jgi:hypothetical protein
LEVELIEQGVPLVGLPFRACFRHLCSFGIPTFYTNYCTHSG